MTVGASAAPAVAVVIVNYRTPGLTVDCLRTLAGEIQAQPQVRVVVVDNASGDDSLDVIGQAIRDGAYQAWCELVAAPKNGGFAYGNNFALQRWFGGAAGEGPELVWLLNPDTLVLPGALTELVRFMRQHREVGIAGGRAENRDGSVRPSAFRFHSPLGELDATLCCGPVAHWLGRYRIALDIPRVAAPVDWVSGASMMVRREVFERVGLLDDAYFMYYEETDFCLRAARAGFACWYVPESRIVHLVGQSSGVTGAQRVARRRPRYWFDSRARYFRVNHGQGTLQLANLLWLAGYPLGRMWAALRGRPYQESPRLWRDFLRYNYWEPS